MENNFRVILALKKKTVADIHNDTGVSKSTLTNFYYERLNNPTFETLYKIASSLEVTIDDLVTVREEVFQ